MNKNDVLNVFHKLAMSQGFYGRLLRDIGLNGENVGEDFWDIFSDCKSDIDVILTIES